MRIQPRTIVFISIAAAAVVFAVVQDRVTAAGARRYVTLQRASPAGGIAETIDSVMRPAVNRSVRVGLAGAGVVLTTGLAIAAFVRRRRD